MSIYDTIIIGEIMNILKKCLLCPKNCGVNRYEKVGFCGINEKIKVALAKPFFYEEPPISGKNGSGTIFFSGCNLKCCFCQNMVISKYNKGKTISINRLAEIMIELQKQRVHNINLVTPTMYIPQIIKAIKKARILGLNIPIVYNSSGYENVDAIKLLDGYIDIYLPDFKYFDDKLAIKYSKVNNYVENAKLAINEMIRQTGPCVFTDDGLIKKGTIIRHLMLPTLKEDTKKILEYLYNKYHDDIYISIMNQYTPNKYVTFNELKEPIKEQDYDEIIDYAINLGIKNAFCQIGNTISESFVPEFNFEGIKKITLN